MRELYGLPLGSTIPSKVNEDDVLWEGRLNQYVHNRWVTFWCVLVIEDSLGDSPMSLLPSWARGNDHARVYALQCD